MTDKNRKLWLDTRGVPVITTTKNGEANAIRWGWTEARAVPADALATRVPVQGEPNEAQVKLAYLAHLKAPRTRGMDVYGPMRAALDTGTEKSE